MIIAQITDTHILPKGQNWKGKPEAKIPERLALVIDHLNALAPKPSVVLLTGDAIDTGGKEAYQHLKEILNHLSIPVFLIPGNHDDREEMRAAFQDKGYMPPQGFIQYVVDDYPVRLIALDTHVPHEDYGMLCKERLNWLHTTLQADTQKPTLIFMHHPPIKAGQKLLDKTRCYSEYNFENLIMSFPNIVGLISGHYHKSSSTIFGKTLCFVAPSVAPVHFFQKADDEYVKSLDLTHASFTLHKWVGGFQLVSEVTQVVEPTHRLPLISQASGYKRTV